MDTLRLSLFLDLARSHSFSATARKFNRSQPAVSIALRKLEEELGVSLIERLAGPLRLTPAGEILKKQASEILFSLSDLKFQASVLAKNPKGYVRFAAVHSVGLYELSDPLRFFIKKYKNIRLALQYHESRVVYKLVENKEVDFGVVAYPESTPSVEVIPMMESPLVVIAPLKHPLSRRGVMALEDLKDCDFVAFSEGLPTRKAIDNALQKNNIRVQICFEDNNIEMIKKAVEVGMGVALIPFKAVNKEGSHRLRVIQLRNNTLKRSIGIIKLKSYHLSRSADLLVQELLKAR